MQKRKERKKEKNNVLVINKQIENITRKLFLKK